MRKLVCNGIISECYLVDEDGQIYNIEGKKMTYHRSNNGYDRVKLGRDIPRRMYLVHRIVAETYIDNPNNLPIVNHKNNVRHDNCVSNLEWCNNSYNQKQRFRSGHKGTKNKKVAQIDINTGAVIKVWETPKEVYRELGIQAQNISKVCRGLRNQAGGYRWIYI